MVSNSNIISSEAAADGPSDERTVTLYEVLEVMGKASFVPMIAIPALIGLTPLGQSVLFAVFAGALIIIAGIQLLMGHNFVRLPNRFAFMPLRSHIAQYFITTLLSTKEWVQESTRQHLVWVTTSGFSYLSYAALVLVGLSLPILTALGQSTFLTLIATLIYCVSLLTRDGRYVLAAGFVLSFASIGLVF